METVALCEALLTCWLSAAGTVAMWGVSLRLSRCLQLHLQGVASLLQGFVLRPVERYFGEQDGGTFIGQVSYFYQSRLRQIFKDSC